MVEKIPHVVKKFTLKVPDKYRIGAEERERLHTGVKGMLEDHNYEGDAHTRANQIIDMCLDGITSKGKCWRGCPDTFEGRLRMFHWDIEKNVPTGTWYGRKAKTPQEGSPETSDSPIPSNLKIDGRKKLLKSTSLLSGEELKEFNKRYNAYMRSFSQLDNPADRSALELLVKMEIMSNRILNSVLDTGDTKGVNTKLDLILADDIKKLQELMGISGNQRSKLVDQINVGSVAELVKLYDEYVNSDEFLKNELIWWKEEAALLLRKMERVFPNGEPELIEAVFQRYMEVPSAVAKIIIKDVYATNFEEALGNAQMASTQEKERGEKKLEKEESSARYQAQKRALERRRRRLEKFKSQVGAT